MLILILIDLQYVQNDVFSLEKSSVSQYQFLSDSHHLIKKFLYQNFPFPTTGGINPLRFNVIWKTLRSSIYLSSKPLGSYFFKGKFSAHLSLHLKSDQYVELSVMAALFQVLCYQTFVNCNYNILKYHFFKEMSF